MSRAEEQAAFERWAERVCPSGDVTEVQRQWEASSDLAEWLESQRTEDVLIDGVAYTVPTEIACELLRLHMLLAQVEAEHAALKKAISDAEPVAWYAPAINGRSVARFDGRPMLMVGAVGNEIHTAPLYTLNGIKP